MPVRTSWGITFLGIAVSVVLFAAPFIWPQINPTTARIFMLLGILLFIISGYLILSDIPWPRFRKDKEISSREALDWIAYRSRWGRRIADDLKQWAALLEFEKKAREGRVEVVGREKNHATVTKLSPHFWETAGLDFIAHFADTPICRTQKRKVVLYEYKDYEDLRVSERQVRKLWPAPLRERLFPIVLHLEKRSA